MSKKVIAQLVALVLLVTAGALLLSVNSAAVPQREFSASQLRQQYVDEGRPEASQLSATLRESLIAAFKGGRLTNVDHIGDGYGRDLTLVSVADSTETNADSCGMYSPGLCLMLDTHTSDPRILRVFDASVDTSIPSGGTIVFGDWTNDVYGVILYQGWGDGGVGINAGSVMSLDDGRLTEIGTIQTSFDEDGRLLSYKLKRGTAEVDVAIPFVEGTDGKIIYSSVTISDGRGTLKTIPGPFPLEAGQPDIVRFDFVSTRNIKEGITFNVSTQASGKSVWTSTFTYDPILQNPLLDFTN